MLNQTFIVILMKVMFGFNRMYIPWHLLSIVLLDTLLKTFFVAVAELSCEEFKRKVIRCSGRRALLYKTYRESHASEAKLLAFRVKANRVRGKVQSRSWCHNLRHLNHFCSSCAAVILIFMEVISLNYPCCCSSYIPEIRTIVLFLPF